MEETLNLYQRLAKIRKTTEVIKKNRSGYGYKYTDLEEILAPVTATMQKYGVSLIPMMSGDTNVEAYTYTKLKKSKEGAMYEEPVTEFLATANLTYRWVNNDDPTEFIDVPWFISGSQTDPSQSLGSALTYGLRYFLLQFFQIATPEDDPDHFRSKQKAAAETESREIAAEIINHFDVALKQYLADNPDKSEEAKKFISRFAKGGNYFSITEPVLAQKLADDFNNTFIGGNK